MAEKILITSDSTTDLSPELREKYNIVVMPLVVSLNDQDHLDGVDIAYHALTVCLSAVDAQPEIRGFIVVLEIPLIKLFP